MDSYDETSEFRYKPSQEFSGILEIFIHHARNIHNICIYEKQDVYAKFSLTYNPDETFSTRIINGGGKNPEFNEKLVIKVNQFDALLKCEMWMLSRAKNFMEDQLLGFSLVPVSKVVENGDLTQDFTLSSTDLFHSPAGTVKLSLSLNTINLPLKHESSEVVLFDPTEYSRIEFPDINVVKENQQMVSQYFGPGSFLCLGAGSNESVQNSGLSDDDDRNSADSLDKNKNKNGLICGNIQTSSCSKNEVKEEDSQMQQQIVDMYIRSMQQFTESLAKMKLPMNLELTVDRPDNNDVETENKKKDGGRVFYGSRAFF